MRFGRSFCVVLFCHSCFAFHTCQSSCMLTVPPPPPATYSHMEDSLFKRRTHLYIRKYQPAYPFTLYAHPLWGGGRGGPSFGLLFRPGGKGTVVHR